MTRTCACTMVRVDTHSGGRGCVQCRPFFAGLLSAAKSTLISHDGLHPPCRLARVWPGSADGGLRWKRHHSHNHLRYNVTARLGREE